MTTKQITKLDSLLVKRVKFTVTIEKNSTVYDKNQITVILGLIFMQISVIFWYQKRNDFYFAVSSAIYRV